MNSNNYISLLLLPILTAVCSAQVVRSDVPAPSLRTNIISKATALLERRKHLSDNIPTAARNPFNPLASDVVVQATAPTRSRLPSSGKELVALLAGQVAPTGSAERDGQRFLLFGQRKVKVGEGIPITFENTQFELEVTAIEGGTFTVRLNQDEFTRPIKPGKTP